MEIEQLPMKECKEIGKSIGIDVVRVWGWYDLIFPERAVRNLDPPAVRKYFYILKSQNEEEANTFLRKRIDSSSETIEEIYIGSCQN